MLLLPAQVSARDKEWEEAKHKEELAALTERFQRRIEQLQAERTEGQSLEAIMQTVSSSADEVRGLTAALQQERLTSLEEKEAAYRARAALLQDKEARLMALASQLEKDRTSGLSLQMSIEQMSQHGRRIQSPHTVFLFPKAQPIPELSFGNHLQLALRSGVAKFLAKDGLITDRQFVSTDDDQVDVMVKVIDRGAA